jgi:cytidyltransferase-like protein
MILNHKDLSKIRKKHQKDKVVFCSGSFDLTHAGHVLFFEDCRKFGNILVVGVGGDKIVRINKGPGRPVLNEHVRLKLTDSLKPVDYSFLDNVSSRISPLASVDMALKKIRPDTYVINDDASNIPYRKKLAQKYGIKLVLLNRRCPAKFEKISTSKIIKKIRGEDLA